MFPRKKIAGFVFRLVLFYGVLVAPWPGLQQAYSTVYRRACNAIFGSFGSGGVVRFGPSAKGRPGTHAEITVRNVRSATVGTTSHSIRFTGYLPAAEVLALILPTPIPWSRRWKALVWGMILVNGFVLLRVWITLLYWFSRDQPWALYHPSPFWSKFIGGLFEFASVSPACSFVVPALIWILVSLRREDLGMILPVRLGEPKWETPNSQCSQNF